MSSLLTKPLVQHHLSRVSPIQLRDFPLGFSCDDHKPAGRRGAGIRRVYTNREKAVAVEKLRRYHMQEHAIFKAYRMTPLQVTSNTVGTVEWNISKWAKAEAQIVEKPRRTLPGT